MVTVKVVLFICTGFFVNDCKEAQSWTTPYNEVGAVYSNCIEQGRLWLKGALTNKFRCDQEVL